MNSDYNNQEVTYCDEDGDYRAFCNLCYKLCIEPFYKSHMKSSTHSTNIHKR